MKFKVNFQSNFSFSFFLEFDQFQKKKGKWASFFTRQNFFLLYTVSNNTILKSYKKISKNLKIFRVGSQRGSTHYPVLHATTTKFDHSTSIFDNLTMFDLIRSRMDLRMEDIGSRSQANTNSHGIPGRGKVGGGRERHENVNSDLNHRTPPRGKIETRCTTEGYLGERGGMMRCRAGIDKEDFPVRYSIRFRNPFRIPARRLAFLPLFSSSSLPSIGRADARGQDTRHQSFLSSLRSRGGRRGLQDSTTKFHPRSALSSLVQYKRLSLRAPFFLPSPSHLSSHPCNPQNIQIYPCLQGKNESKKKRREKKEEECERQGEEGKAKGAGVDDGKYEARKTDNGGGSCDRRGKRKIRMELERRGRAEKRVENRKGG